MGKLSQRRMVVTSGHTQTLQTLSLSSEETELVQTVRAAGGVEKFLAKVVEAAEAGIITNAAGDPDEYVMEMPTFWPNVTKQPVTPADDGDADEYVMEMPTWPSTAKR